MPLPILNSRQEPSQSDLIRLFYKTETLWVEHVAEGEPLEMGTAYSNPSLGEVHEANLMREVALNDDVSPQQAFEEVEAYYRSKATPCYYWSFNPSITTEAARPMVELLLLRGYQAIQSDIMALGRVAPPPIEEMADVKIIPARASFKHTRQLFEEDAADKTPQLAEANMMHLDDPHWDSLLAIKDGQPLAHMGVLAVGEIGRIESVYVAKAHRGKGLATLMMGRVLEICARSLFKHVMLSVLPQNAVAIGLYQRFGFRKIGQITNYLRPGIQIKP
jgi:ribosomal protein S18 acetylase RimI-like enzyme